MILPGMWSGELELTPGKKEGGWNVPAALFYFLEPWYQDKGNRHKMGETM